MDNLDKLNIDKIEKKIERIRDEKQVYNDTLAFYNFMLAESPNLKYVLSAWIIDMGNRIKECDVEIQYWLEVLKETKRKIKVSKISPLPNE